MLNIFSLLYPRFLKLLIENFHTATHVRISQTFRSYFTILQQLTPHPTSISDKRLHQAHILRTYCFAEPTDLIGQLDLRKSSHFNVDAAIFQFVR